MKNSRILAVAVLLTLGAAQASIRTIEGTNLLFSEISGCKDSDYVDGKSLSTIAPGGGGYSPKCLRVHVGAQVTIVGSSRHPAQGMDPIDGIVNPFQSSNGPSKSAITKVLKEPGFYGFYCENHGTPQGEGMAGSIQVIP